MQKKKINLDADLMPFTKINSNQIKDLTINCKAIKFLDNIGENLGSLGFDNEFLDTTPKA